MTSNDQAAVARATAAVFVDGRRAGSAVLVGPRHLVTAAHVLQRQDPDTLAKVAVEQAELEFPGQEPGRAAAARLDLGAACSGVDVAVLDLGEDRPGWLPAPVPVWPAARPPGRVQVFGYPLAEGPLNGVWRRFTVAGPAATGAVQLDWVGEAGTFLGHSGGPVIDADEHSLAGILVQGSESGLFDRFLPVTLIARVWPRLPQPWLITGAEPGEARSHFTRRACGQRSAARGGDLFRGRHAALDRVREWLTATEAPGQPLVLTGQPGAGKSAVLARAALSVEAEHGGPGLAFHARAATIGDFLTALADLTGADTPASADELVTTLADMPGQSPLPVFLDALDEAASDRDRRQITETLAELAVLPWLRVAVATRTMAASNPFAPGGLLPALGVAARDDHNLIDLDSDTYFDLDGLCQFTAALLAQDGVDRPGPPGAAWTQYRAQHGVRDRLAAVIAERAGRNFLVAAMAAVPLSTARTMTDPAAKGFDPAGIPSGVGEALSKYLDRLPEQRRDRDPELLTALAYARGAGLDDPAWLAFAAALGYSATVADLDALRRSPAADYLLQTTTTERRARPVTRLFHQALTDELLAPPRHKPSDESALLDMLLSQAARTGWQDRYLRDHAAEHAAAADRLDQLLTDDAYLLHADLHRVLQAVGSASSEAGLRRARLLRLTPDAVAASPAGRAALFSVTETLENLGTWYRTGQWEAPFRAEWSTVKPRSELAAFKGHTNGVNGVCAVTIDGRALIASGGRDGTVRLWDPRSGQQLAVLEHGQNWVQAVCEIIVDGRALLASVGMDGAELWDPRSGERLFVLEGHENGAWAVCSVTVNGRALLATGGAEDGTVRLWDPRIGEQVAHLEGHNGRVRALCAVTVDDHVLLASGGDDGTVRLRDPSGGQLANVGGLRGTVQALCAVTVDGLKCLASVGGDDDRTVRLWDPRTGELLRVLEDQQRGFGAVCSVSVNGRSLLATGGGGALRLWDPGSGEPPAVLEGHESQINAVCEITVDGRSLLASGGDDRTVRLWDPSNGECSAVDEGRQGLGWVNAVCSVTVDGRSLLAGGGDIAALRLWDPRSGEQLAVLEDHQGWVDALCAVTVDGRAMLALAGHHPPDNTVRLWDPRTGEQLTFSPGHQERVNALCAVTVDGHVFLAGSGGGNSSLRLWDPRTGDQVCYTREPGFIKALCAVTVDDRALLATAGSDGIVRLQDLRTGEQFAIMKGHNGVVNAVCDIVIDGRTLILTGGTDSTVRLWDARTGGQIAIFGGHQAFSWFTTHDHGVNAVCAVTIGSRAFPASGGQDRTVRIWDPRTGACLITVPTHHQIRDLAGVAGSLAIALDAGILMIRPEAARFDGRG